MRIILQYLLPQHTLTRLFRYLIECRHTAIKNWMIKTFIKKYAVDMTIAQDSNIASYENFQAFFIRRLRPGARPLPIQPNIICSPVDGAILQYGEIQQGKMIEAKHYHYSFHQLIGHSQETPHALHHGRFLTAYLAPHDYHRFHMPVTGRLQAMRYIPGRLFSVNPTVVKQIDQLFTRNERIVCFFETEHGPFILVMVGAMLVGSITTTWAGKITPPRATSVYENLYHDQAIHFKQGEELGYFSFGSTVIMITPHDWQWSDTLSASQSIVMGQAIGNIPCTQ
ncbi:MAG: hypothetical protein Tsb005_10920 [Gammaproteobacteria bacterium]